MGALARREEVVSLAAVEAERALLGGVLINGDVYWEAAEVLGPVGAGAFHEPAHAALWGCIARLAQSGRPVDVVLIFDALGEVGMERVGGPAYIADLTNVVPTSANVGYYAGVVLEHFKRREIVRITSDMQRDITRGHNSTEVIQAAGPLMALNDGGRGGLVAVSACIDAAIDRMGELHKQGGITGVRTGLHRLDVMTSGLQPQDAIILAARPSVGKTGFALSVAKQVVVDDGKAALFFSLEMAKEKLVERLLMMIAGVNTDRLRRGFAAQSALRDLHAAAEQLSQARFFIDDTSGLTIEGIRARARQHVLQHGAVDLIIVDYIQLVASPKAENKRLEVDAISKGVKALARELRCPVIALSQLTREAEKSDAGPEMAHMMESGALEADADVVLMLSRAPAHEREKAPDLMKVSIKKQRNGATGDFPAIFERATQRWFSVAEAHGEEPARSPYPEEAAVIAPWQGDSLPGIADDDIPFD